MSDVSEDLDSRLHPRRGKVAGIVDHRTLDSIRREAGEAEERDRAPLSFHLIRRLLGFTLPYRGKLALLMASVFVRSVQMPLLAWAVGAIIRGPVAQKDENALIWWVLGFALFALFTEITFHFRIKWALELGEAVIHDLRATLFRHWLRLDMGYFNCHAVGRLIGRLTGDSENVRVGVQNVLFVSLVQAGQMLGCAAIMLWEDWVLFLAVLGMAPIVWALNRIFRARLGAAYRNQSDSYSRITATMAESVSGIRVTQSFSREGVNAEHFRYLVVDHSRLNMVSARTSGLFLPLLELSGQLFLALLVVLGGWRALQPDIAMPLGSVIQFFFLAGLFFSPITVLGNMFNEALSSMAGAEKVFGVLDTQPAWEEPVDAEEPESFAGRVEFRGVGFSYMPGRRVLENVSFVAEPGHCVAIVGATGGGKSTLASLIAKFYLPETGEVLLDGIDTRRLSGTWLRGHLGIVPQHNHLFEGTILDNIRVVRPDATEADVREALQRLDCLDAIEGAPGGLHAAVGERGASLSLGQRQLVCFARALLADPEILILDEATSAIDPITEARTQKAMRRLLQGRTSFIVAHRLSTLRHADTVLVMEHGRLVEQGSPADLLGHQDGTFARLWQKAGMLVGQDGQDGQQSQ